MQNNLEVPLFHYPNLPSDAGDPSSPCSLQRWMHWNTTRHNMTESDHQQRGIKTFGKTQINLFVSWSLTHWWLWLTGKFNTAFLQTLANGAEQKIDPTAHIMKQLRPREFIPHFWSQAVSYCSRAWKSNCDRFLWKNANLWDARQDLFWSAGLRCLIPRDPIWCESRNGVYLDWFKTLFGGV